MLTSTSFSRRSFLAFGGAAFAATPVQSAEVLPPWTPGTLDIHHISTGRGSCAFLLCPDGTTMMVDCGATKPQPGIAQFLIDAKPDATRRPAEWVTRYISRQMAPAGRKELDYFLLTHFHGDHMGEFLPEAPLSHFGDYRLNGIAELAETIPVGRVIDRGWPDYDYPAPLTDIHAKNYMAFARSSRQRTERFVPGALNQLKLRFRATAFPGFSIRNLVANGELWTGIGDATRQQFPPLASLSPAQYPTENMCSLGIRLSYGKFDYFTAGDMSNDTNFGRDEWRDIETPTAKAAGPVEVAVANHHGYMDATGAGFVAALRPRAFVINAWDSAHPTIAPLANMLSRELYPGDREIYATAMKPEAKIAVRRLSELASDDGHVVFRVDATGDRFAVYITTNSDESDRVKAKFGHFPCR